MQDRILHLWWHRIPWRRAGPAALLVGGIALLCLAFQSPMVAHLRERWQPDPIWAEITARGVWRVGLDPSFPPFEHISPQGELEGLDVDLARAIARQWEVKVAFVTLGYDGLIEAVQSRKVHAAISAIPYDSLLTQDVRFSDPYFDAGWRLVVPRAASAQTPDDLTTAAVAVEWGTEGHVWAKRLQRKFPQMRLVLRLSPSEVVDAVLAGEADAAVVDGVTAQQYRNALRVIQALSAEPYVIVMPYQAYRLQEEVNRALATLRASGYLDMLVARWLRPPESNR